MKKRFAVIKPKRWVFPAVLIIAASAALMSFTESDAAERKTVYFTFDDGPSAVTEEILDILSENGIKATFFVIGPQGEKTDGRLKMLSEAGHNIGLHTYSHKYSEIYASAESFLADIEKEQEWIASVTGEEPIIFRFPGGSTNRHVDSSLIKEISEKMNAEGYTFYDWNADGCDSLYCGISAEEISKYVLRDAKDKDTVVVLMHDSSISKGVPGALKILIEDFGAMGYEFGDLEKLEEPLQFK